VREIYGRSQKGFLQKHILNQGVIASPTCMVHAHTEKNSATTQSKLVSHLTDVPTVRPDRQFRTEQIVPCASSLSHYEKMIVPVARLPPCCGLRGHGSLHMLSARYGAKPRRVAHDYKVCTGFLVAVDARQLPETTLPLPHNWLDLANPAHVEQPHAISCCATGSIIQLSAAFVCPERVDSSCTTLS
jgi:hypothetical protein